MDSLSNKWLEYVLEGIENDEHNFKYYAFDWDDNIVFMPTKIVLLDKDNNEVQMSTEDFAEYREQIKNGEPVEYEGKTIVGYAPEPYRFFRPKYDKLFIKDALSNKIELGPSWDDFVECLNTGSIFAIITARGHSPSALKRAVYNYIIANFNGIKSGEVIKNIKKYNKLFSAMGKDASIKGYLDLCKFYPVSYGPLASSMGSPEEAKVKALQEFTDYCKKLNKGMPVKIGFSDDDRKNIELIEKHFAEPTDMVDMTIKYTGKGERE